MQLLAATRCVTRHYPANNAWGNHISGRANPAHPFVYRFPPHHPSLSPNSFPPYLCLYPFSSVLRSGRQVQLAGLGSIVCFPTEVQATASFAKHLWYILCQGNVSGGNHFDYFLWQPTCACEQKGIRSTDYMMHDDERPIDTTGLMLCRYGKGLAKSMSLRGGAVVSCRRRQNIISYLRYTPCVSEWSSSGTNTRLRTRLLPP